MVKVKKMKYMNIYSDSNGSYIVHNTRKEFSVGHTHINNFHTAEYVAYMALYKRLPKKNHLSLYLIDSVIRVSEDKNFIQKMEKFKLDMINKKRSRIE